MSQVCFSKIHNCNFTTQDVAFLVQELKPVIQDLQEEIMECRENINVYWERSNPDSFHGEYFFTSLNMYRDEKRKLSKKLAKLASIQAKLKELR